MTNEIATFNFEIRSLTDAMEYAKLIAESDLVPKDYKGKPGNVLVAIQYGMEIGLKPLQAVQNIAVINGRPAIWGDALIALVMGNPLCEYIKEEIKNGIATCCIKRRGQDEHITSFSIDDAKKANLWGKVGPWSQYPERMLQMRARGFALRDKFSDVLKGLAMAEEVMDYKVNIEEPSKKTLGTLIEANHFPKIEINELQLKIENVTNLEELRAIRPEILKAPRAVKETYQKKLFQLKKESSETGETNQNGQNIE